MSAPEDEDGAGIVPHSDLEEAVELLRNIRLHHSGYCNACGCVECAPDCRLDAFLKRHPEAAR